jgi:hypothetical protein
MQRKMGFTVDKNQLNKNYTIGSSGAGVLVFKSVFESDSDINPPSVADKMTRIRVWLNPVAGATWDAAMTGDVLSYSVDEDDAKTSVYDPATFTLTVEDGSNFGSTESVAQAKIRNVFKDITFSCTYKGVIGARQVLYAVDYEDDDDDEGTFSPTADELILISVGPSTAPEGPPKAPSTVTLSPGAIAGIVLGSIALLAIIIVLIVLYRRRSS